MHACMHMCIYIYTFYLMMTFGIPTSMWTLGFPGPRWMHVPPAGAG